jgi:hypothetical protein
MEKSILIPYLRKGLDILFVGLNPAKGSSDNGHYFSVNQAFWNQLLDSGLITKSVNKLIADEIIFQTTKINFSNWNYGITDLVTEIAESNSQKIKPTISHCMRLAENISLYKPKTVVLLHSKVTKSFLNFLNRPIPKSNAGNIGNILPNSDTAFFNIAFPHGNSITSLEKVKRYNELKEHIEPKNN